MTRIGIITCANCTHDGNCASVVCLSDLRNRRGHFSRYPTDTPLDLIGVTSCAGCPTLAAPDKILKRIRGLAAHRIDALHFSYCVTALCPFLKRYRRCVQEQYPDLSIILGTHQPLNTDEFRRGVHEVLCPSVCAPKDMNDMMIGTLVVPDNQLTSR